MKYFVFYPIYPNDKVYHFLPYMVGGCPGTLVSSTTKTGRHEIAEILLKIDQSEFLKSHGGHVF
jgi:hypothetical protein